MPRQRPSTVINVTRIEAQMTVALHSGPSLRNAAK